MKKQLLIGIAVLLVVAYAMPQKKNSLEFMLATIDKGYVSPDDILIVRFRNLLEQLDRTFKENKTQISDMTVGTQKILKEEVGIKESLLNIMVGMNSIFLGRKTIQSYSEFCASYLALRQSGQSHRDAIAGLKAMMNIG